MVDYRSCYLDGLRGSGIDQVGRLPSRAGDHGGVDDLVVAGSCDQPLLRPPAVTSRMSWDPLLFDMRTKITED